MNKINLSNFHYTESVKHSSNRSYKYVLLGFVVIIAILLVLFVFRRIDTNNDNNENAIKTVESHINADAYFIPPKRENLKRTQNGKILHAVPVSVDGKEISFKLVNKEDNTLMYLYSETNDLNLSVGFDVEVVGTIEKTAYNGISIMKVESIILK